MNNPTVKKYCKPTIEMVCLDNEISLQLASGIPAPGDAYSPQSILPDFMQQDPFKGNNA
jgi:hypothetical protein